MTDWKDRFITRGTITAGELAHRFNIRNPRKHPDRQAGAVEGSLNLLGWIAAVKLSSCGGETDLKRNKKAVMFDGHLRVKLVLSKFGPDALVPVEWYDLSEGETNQALLVLDQMTGMAELDFTALDDLIKNTPPLEIPDFSDWMSEVLEGAASALLKGNEPPPETPPAVDKAEQLQEKWQVKPGDIWQIDHHFVICGDCREPETWQRLLSAAGIEKVNGVFTSPPYAEQRKAQYGGVPTAEYVEWWDAVQSNVRENLAGDGSFFVNIKPHCEDGQRVLYVFDLVLAMVRRWGWRFVDELCWERKGVPGGWSNRFKNEFEPVYQFSLSEDIKFRKYQVGEHSSYAFDVSKRHKNHNSVFDCNADNGKVFKEGLALPGNVIVANGQTEQEHNAAFPVALPTFFIKAYSDPGDSWLDPFCGSGTTIVAAHNEGRTGLGIERLPKYVSVILERLQAHTKQEPRLIK